MAEVAYTTRETVKRSLDVAETARSNAQIDEAILAASREVENLLRRVFYPWTGTRYFDWPNRNSPTSWRLWLDANEMASVSAVIAGGTTVTPGTYFLRRSDRLDVPPFTHIELDLGTNSAFGIGTTSQRDLAITGVYCGCPVDLVQIGTLSATLAASNTATASISFTTARFGVGDILKVDDEYVIITERTMVDTTQDLTQDLTASQAAVSIPVSNGAGFAVDEVLLVDSERMLVVDIAGNTLTVKRAWDGSALAAHTTGASIYAHMGIDIDRGQLGTSLAAHSSSTAVYLYRPPSLVRQLATAETLNAFEQQRSAYARVVGSGDNEREASGKGLSDLRREAIAAYGRQARTRAV